MLKTWTTPTHVNSEIMKISGNTLQEAVNGNIRKLLSNVVPSSEQIVSYPDIAHLEYSDGIFGGKGGVKALIDCIVSTGYIKGNPNYKEFPKQYEVWIHANKSDI